MTHHETTPTAMEVSAACIGEHSREQWPPAPSNGVWR